VPQERDPSEGKTRFPNSDLQNLLNAKAANCRDESGLKIKSDGWSTGSPIRWKEMDSESDSETTEKTSEPVLARVSIDISPPPILSNPETMTASSRFFSQNDVLARIQA
jgi:hypothetical protein